MPTYGYECLSCENQFETYQSIKDDALTTCDACGGTLRKRIYPVGISFKGSGFYVNDYAPPGSARSKPAESGDAPASSGGDAKPETKPDGAKPDGAKPDGAKPDGAKAEPKAEVAPTPKAESAPAVKSDTKAPATTP